MGHRRENSTRFFMPIRFSPSHHLELQTWCCRRRVEPGPDNDIVRVAHTHAQSLPQTQDASQACTASAQHADGRDPAALETKPAQAAPGISLSGSPPTKQHTSHDTPRAESAQSKPSLANASTAATGLKNPSVAAYTAGRIEDTHNAEAEENAAATAHNAPPATDSAQLVSASMPEAVVAAHNTSPATESAQLVGTSMQGAVGAAKITTGSAAADAVEETPLSTTTAADSEAALGKAKAGVPVMLLLSGPPGSGKSTFCGKLIAQSKVAWSRVNQDTINGGQHSTFRCLLLTTSCTKPSTSLFCSAFAWWNAAVMHV